MERRVSRIGLQKSEGLVGELLNYDRTPTIMRPDVITYLDGAPKIGIGRSRYSSAIPIASAAR
jgi:hypothetical protein